MSNKAVSRLRNEIHQLHKAQRDRKDDAHDLRTDERSLDSERKQVERQRDRFVDNRKDLKKERKDLGKVRETEQKRLDEVQSKQEELQQEYDASIDPLTGLGDPALQARLDEVAQRATDIQAKFDPMITADQGDIDKLKEALQRGRLDIKHSRSAIDHDRREIKHDKKALDRSQDRVKRDRQDARDDLRPAEYQMNLEQTNKARKELGLKPVDEVIRPGVPNTVGGQVGEWIAQAQTILKNAGVPMSKMSAKGIAIIIQHESGGDPKAVNNWDSNAAAGTPSEGLMQTIGPTFNSYKLKGHDHILNPVDNIIAGVRYAISRYGSVSNVPGVVAVHRGGAYVGY